jgi:cytochrome c peroxidase
MLLLLSFLALFSQANAQNSDQELTQYIQMLGLKGLPAPTQKNEALYQLGLRLFYDKQLSGKNNISCHACHSLSGFSADTLPLAVGEGAEGLAKNRIQSQGVLIPRHTPALYNLGLAGVNSLFWDGRIMKHPQGGWLTPEEGLNGPNPKLKEIALTLDGLLAAQALFPMSSDVEMLGQGSPLNNVEAWEAIMERLFTGRLGASYKRFFREAFTGVEKFNIGHAANAIAELERHHFLANNTPWDNYVRGEKKFMTERMKKGATLFFGKASCTNCHTGDHFSSFGFQNIGVPQIGPGKENGDDKGRFDYRFRVSPLRNTALTAPYMHSGAFATMWEVIDHYDHPMRSLHHFNWDPKHPSYREDLKHDDRQETMMARTKTLATNLPRNLGLSVEEKKDLYCFLMVALTDLKNQADLLTKGVLDEIDDCSPLLTDKKH